MLVRGLKFFIIIAALCSGPTYADSLNEMVTNLIIEKLGDDVVELELSFDNKSKAQIPNINNKDVKSVGLTYYDPSYSSFRVSVTAKDDQMFDLFGRYKAFVHVPVLSKGISAGTIITESDIMPIKTLYSRVKSGYVIRVGDIVGMQAKRTLAGGSFIKRNDILKPQVVRKGDNVSMIYDHGNIKLRTNGIADQSGAIGDNIKVKNEATGTMVHGIVKGKNLVEVGG
jgi:flagella basal body P-ring formation protein FlgA